MTIRERLSALRQRMADYHIDAYYIPTDDFHCSEYVGEYFECRRWISGFTGSAGCVIVTQSCAGLWTDGRYFLQAAQQLSGSSIKLYRSGEPGVPAPMDFLCNVLSSGQCLGFDGRTVTAKWCNQLRKKLSDPTITLRTDIDLIGSIWHDRPPLSCQPAWELDSRYAGKTRRNKLCWLRQELKANGADWLVISTLDDIAWLLNLRGNDIAYNPVVLSYLMVSQNEVRLFIQEASLNLSVKEALQRDRVRCYSYDSITDHLSHLHNCCVQLDRSRVSAALMQSLCDNVSILDMPSPTQLAKAVKNPIEIKNMREAHRKDGVAIVRFLQWLEQNIGRIPITEISAALKLEEFRKQQEHYLEPSFAPISAYGEHGAIVHYSATEESDSDLLPQGFLLLDTGGQYLEGTTDITRTIALGTLSMQMKQHYTAVLRGNLNLAGAVFRSGCTGVNLDLLARAPLWEQGLDFNHGTGHGVGYLLCCHEGPNSFRWKISPNPNDNAVFQEGMITSDEPGLYLAKEYGIRLENLLVCQKHSRTSFGSFLCFSPLTLVPFDLNAVLPEQMSERERSLLNDYHSLVYRELAPRLTDDECSWLKNATRPI